MKVSNNTNKEAADISQLHRSKKGDKASAAKEKESSNANAIASSVGDAANVNISSEAKAMSKAKEIASSEDIDQAKVDRVKAMIDKGTYKPDYGKVADKLINEHLMQDLS